MSAHSWQTDSGITPRRIKTAKIRQPTHTASTDSAKAKATIRPRRIWETHQSPANQLTVAAVVTAAPMPWANRLGGPGTKRVYLVNLGATTRVASCPNGLSVGPVR